MSLASFTPTKYDVAIASLNRDLTRLPTDLNKELEEVNRRLLLCKKSFKSVGIGSDNILMYPKHLIIELSRIKSEIIKFCVDNQTTKNKLTKYYLQAILVERYLKENVLNVPLGYPNKINFEFLSGLTHRTGMREKSFPILNLQREKRDIVKPNGDLLIEYDLNSADIRSILLCLGWNQPKKDIYTHLINLFGFKLSREEFKKSILIWVHSPNRHPEFNKIFDRESILNKFYDKNKLYNYYGFELDCDEEKAFGYLIQSTTSVFFLESIYRTIDFLVKKETQSRILFGIHDSVVLDYYKEDEIKGIKTVFEGKYWSTTKIGKDFGHMRKI